MDESTDHQVLPSPKKWWWTTIFVTLALLILQFFLFRWEKVYDLCWEFYYEDHVWWVDTPAKHIVIGSSSAMNSIMPNRIHKENELEANHSLNLGMNGVTPIIALANLKRYLKRFPPPERVDLAITPSMFTEAYHVAKGYEKIYLSWGQWEHSQKWKNKNRPKITNSYFFPAMLFWSNLNFNRNYLFRQYHFTLDEMRTTRGFRPIYERSHSIEIRRTVLPLINKHFGWSHPQLAALRKTHQLLDDLGVKIYHLITPLHPKAYVIFEEDDAALKELELLLSQTVSPRPVLGSLNPTPLGLTHENFFNADHITVSGARKFTSKVYGNMTEHHELPTQQIDFIP